MRQRVDDSLGSSRFTTRLLGGFGLSLLLAGSVLGIAAAAATTPLLSSAVADVNPRDPLVFAASLVVIAAAALLATLLPARRAAKVDPMTELRHG